MPNPWWKLTAAIAAVLTLSAPAAVGVFRALAPTRGPVAAALAAAGIELVYLSLALLTLRPELRKEAQRVAVAAVATSIVLNVLADYAARVAGGLASWPAAVAAFDPLALGLAVVESAPLAGLAFALASLLHRLAEAPAQLEVAPAAELEQPAQLEVATSWARVEPYPAPVAAQLEVAPVASQTATNALHPCPRCQAPLTTGQYGAAQRWGYCASCKPKGEA